MQSIWFIVIPVTIAVGVYLALLARRHGRQPRPEAGGVVDAQKECLLLLLRRSPAVLTADALEAAACAAWEDRFGPKRDGNEYVQPGSSDSVVLLHAHGNAFLVIASDRIKRKLRAPDILHPESAAQLWSEYSHDLSVGVAHDFDTNRANLEAYVASLAVALCDESTIGVFHPFSGQVWRLDEAVLERLATAPEAFFRPARSEIAR